MSLTKQRPGMWIAVDRDIANHKKFRRQPFSKFELVGLLVGIIGASAERRQDGFVDLDDLDDLAIAADPAHVTSMVECLVSIGSLAVVEGGYYVTGYASWQITEDEESAQRTYERERKARQRAQAKARTETPSPEPASTSHGTNVDVPGDLEAGPTGQEGLSQGCPTSREEEELEEKQPASREAAASSTSATIEAPYDGYALVEELLTSHYAKPAPLGQTKGRILKAVKTLLDDQVDAEHIREGLRWWTWRHAVDGASPAHITAVVDDIRNGRRPATPNAARADAPGGVVPPRVGTGPDLFADDAAGDDALYGGAA